MSLIINAKLCLGNRIYIRHHKVFLWITDLQIGQAPPVIFRNRMNSGIQHPFDRIHRRLTRDDNLFAV